MKSTVEPFRQQVVPSLPGAEQMQLSRFNGDAMNCLARQSLAKTAHNNSRGYADASSSGDSAPLGINAAPRPADPISHGDATDDTVAR